MCVCAHMISLVNKHFLGANLRNCAEKSIKNEDKNKLFFQIGKIAKKKLKQELVKKKKRKRHKKKKKKEKRKKMKT